MAFLASGNTSVSIWRMQYIYIASYIYICILHTANMAMGYYNRLLMGYYYNILEYIPANVQTWTGVVKEIFFDKTLAGIFVVFFQICRAKMFHSRKFCSCPRIPIGQKPSPSTKDPWRISLSPLWCPGNFTSFLFYPCNFHMLMLAPSSFNTPLFWKNFISQPTSHLFGFFLERMIGPTNPTHR